MVQCHACMDACMYFLTVSRHHTAGALAFGDAVPGNFDVLLAGIKLSAWVVELQTYVGSRNERSSQLRVPSTADPYLQRLLL